MVDRAPRSHPSALATGVQPRVELDRAGLAAPQGQARQPPLVGRPPRPRACHRRPPRPTPRSLPPPRSGHSPAPKLPHFRLGGTDKTRSDPLSVAVDEAVLGDEVDPPSKDLLKAKMDRREPEQAHRAI